MTCDVSFPQSKSTGSWDELHLTGYAECAHLCSSSGQDFAKQKHKMTLMSSFLSHCICGDPLPVSDSEVRTLFNL